MDISNIEDIDKLKSLAFDEISKADAAQQNLRLLQARIAQVQETDKQDVNN